MTNPYHVQYKVQAKHVLFLCACNSLFKQVSLSLQWLLPCFIVTFLKQYILSQDICVAHLLTLFLLLCWCPWVSCLIQEAVAVEAEEESEPVLKRGLAHGAEQKAKVTEVHLLRSITVQKLKEKMIAPGVTQAWWQGEKDRERDRDRETDTRERERETETDRDRERNRQRQTESINCGKMKCVCHYPKGPVSNDRGVIPKCHGREVAEKHGEPLLVDGGLPLFRVWTHPLVTGSGPPVCCLQKINNNSTVTSTS